MADLGFPTAQPPAQQKVDRLIEFSAIARRNRRYERARRAESQWRKRSCALMLGVFKDTEPDPVTGRRYTDEDALDAFTPHGSEKIEDRCFPEDVERREQEAWSHVETAMKKGRTECLDACRAYLRLVEAMDRAVERGFTLKPLTLGSMGKPSLQSLKLRRTRRRRST